MTKKIISALLALCIIFASAMPAFTADSTPLRFDKNGEFKILHLCDFQDGYPMARETITYVNYVLDNYKPDLVVLGGDNCVCYEKDKPDAIKEICDIFVAKETYFTLVFGNHDDEQGVDKDTLLKYYQQYGGKYCLAYEDDPDLHGAAIHNLTVLASDSDEIKFNLWMFDTNTYVYDENDPTKRLGYDNVREDQIEWYKEKSAELEAKAGKKVYSIAFQHMTPPETYEAMFPTLPFDLSPVTETYNGGKHYPVIFPDTSVFKGHIMEPPSPGVYNHGHFDAMVERGDVLGVFVGHDHKNSYEVEYKDIMIINSPGITYNAYSSEFIKGGRLITINEDNTSTFESELIPVNVIAMKNADFAESMGINRLEAAFYVFFGDFLLLLKNLSAPIAWLIY